MWGYFSVKSGGGIHEFSDSQFGHLFAKGETREAAIRNMVVALRDVRVRGEIHTIIDYAVDMLTSGVGCGGGGRRGLPRAGGVEWPGRAQREGDSFPQAVAWLATTAACPRLPRPLISPLLRPCPALPPSHPHPQDFVQNRIHTGWLDSRIAANVKAERPPWHLCVIGSAVVRAYESITSKAAEYLGFLSKGQLPPRDVGLIRFRDDLVLEGVKYRVSVVRR